MSWLFASGCQGIGASASLFSCISSQGLPALVGTPRCVEDINPVSLLGACPRTVTQWVVQHRPALWTAKPPGIMKMRGGGMGGLQCSAGRRAGSGSAWEKGMLHTLPGEGPEVGGGRLPISGRFSQALVWFQQNPSCVTVWKRLGKWAYVLDRLILDKTSLHDDLPRFPQQSLRNIIIFYWFCAVKKSWDIYLAPRLWNLTF